jgi:predicted RNA-binding Zn ribbon-like protein
VEFASYKDRSVAAAVDLVNTHSPFSGHEHLTGPAELAAFLDRHDMRPARPPTEKDLAEVRAIRERVRAVFEAGDPERASTLLNRLLRDVDAHPQLAAHDGEPWHIHFAPTEAPLARHVAATAGMGLAVVLAEGGFDRLGVCAWERCRDVFVDTTKNRSRRFCKASVCGNRSSAAAYRARQKAAD